MKALGGVEAFLTSALDGGKWLTSFPTHLTPGKGPHYQISSRLGGPQSCCGHFGEERNLNPIPAFKPWTVQPIT
jgi:hypothetical protein